MKTQHIEAMREFVFNGMGFGDSEEDVEDRFAESEYDAHASDPKAGINVYNVLAPGVDLAKLWFFNDRLFMVRLAYGVERVRSMGDWTAIAERLVARFGKGNADSAGLFPENDKGQFVQFDWEFEEIARSIELAVFTQLAVVTFADENLRLAAFNKKKREADLGF